VQEAVGEFDVVAGGAHRDGERLAVDADLERLLDDDRVGAAGVTAVRGDADDGTASDHTAHGRAPGSMGSRRAAMASAGPGSTTAKASAAAAPRSMAEPP